MQASFSVHVAFPTKRITIFHSTPAKVLEKPIDLVQESNEVKQVLRAAQRSNLLQCPYLFISMAARATQLQRHTSVRSGSHKKEHKKNSSCAPITPKIPPERQSLPFLPEPPNQNLKVFLQWAVKTDVPNMLKQGFKKNYSRTFSWQLSKKNQ